MPAVFVTDSRAHLGRSNFGFGAAAGLAQTLKITESGAAFPHTLPLGWSATLRRPPLAGPASGAGPGRAKKRDLALISLLAQAP